LCFFVGFFTTQRRSGGDDGCVFIIDDSGSSDQASGPVSVMPAGAVAEEDIHDGKYGDGRKEAIEGVHLIREIGNRHP
jgi:hypothetical protein